MYAYLLTDGRRTGSGGLSPRSVRYIATILGKAFSDAVKKGILSRNVALAADPPSAKSARPPEMQTWTPAELATFLHQNKGDTLFTLFRVASMTGLRRGEVCGLRWPDLDLEEGKLSVRQQLATDDHVPRFGSVKTEQGERTLDLDAETVAVLRDLRRRQAAERLAAGPVYQSLNLVFSKYDGSPLHPEAVSKVFARRVAKSELPRLRFHDLRHTHATHLIAAGVHVKVVSERLGHASVAFTLDRYGHVLPNLQSDAATAVALLVDG